ncbi:MAG: protein phosphatase 2C domain-containing protein [Planctomycetes bacterium]|nr:protein phosphatase 2C domain-containing protein [Planctomycetota bacterium]
MVQIRSGSLSITGNFRENNEDRCFADPQGRYFLVADGMGGQSAGEKASEMAVQIVSRKLEQRVNFDSDSQDKVLKAIDEAVAEANAEIMAVSQIDPTCHNMGTTINFVIAAGGSLYTGGVGDSRIYRLRGSKLEQLTVDHSLTQALLDAGTISEKEAEHHRYKNVLYRYLGTKEGGTGTGARKLDPAAGDRFVLCSDGVTDGLAIGKLKSVVEAADDPQAAADELVRAAQEGGSKDNITCIVLFVE